ncbi:MAG TPA: DUF6492 family protein [Tepidisphaeraceae bacterium]|jgi:hypothetical protein|nr:DUF6492 family protein [Tepidisphaeraceae bacterium]
MTHNAEAIDTFMCVHSSDVPYLLELAVRSWRINFRPKGRLYLICNQRHPIQNFVDRNDLSDVAVISTDADWLSAKELSLHGWYRQQLIKLRAYRICSTANFCNLGADTILLRAIELDDLLVDGYPIAYYTARPRTIADPHYRYELFRTLSLARILRTLPTRTLRHVDFIADLFTFNRADLMALDDRMTALHGADAYHALLHRYGTSARNHKRFGEWTLYTMFVLDVLRRQPVLRDMSRGFLRQAHSQSALQRMSLDVSVLHVASKQCDVDVVARLVNPRLAQSAPTGHASGA